MVLQGALLVQLGWLQHAERLGSVLWPTLLLQGAVSLFTLFAGTVIMKHLPLTPYLLFSTVALSRFALDVWPSTLQPPVNAERVPILLDMLIILAFSGMAVMYGRLLLRFRQAERAVSQQDPLTGILNRDALLSQWHLQSNEQPATLVLFDVNDLKLINDTGGHGAGDTHLKQVAQALLASLPPHAFVSRWGGDEFLAVLPGVDEQQAQTFVKTVLDGTPASRSGMLPLAVGTAALRPGEGLDRALALADQRMYLHKVASKQTAHQSLTAAIPTLEEFTRLLESLPSTHALLQDGLDALRQILRFDGSAYYERRGERLFPTYVTGGEESDLAAQRERQGRPLDSGTMGIALQTDQTYGTADYPSEPEALPEWIQRGLKSAVATPVRVTGRTVGTLNLTSYQHWRAITPQVSRLLEAVALRLGHLLEREQLIRRGQELLTWNLRTTSLVLEARGIKPRDHTSRLLRQVETFAQTLGASDEQGLALQQGTYLHDLGLLVLPDWVLGTTNPLSPQERTAMQEHVLEGYRLAEQIAGITSGALEVMLGHHEHWDGSGYPSGLSGDTIPWLARVFALCAAYEAMTVPGSYRPARSPEDALHELQQQAGKQFDPLLTRHFIQMQQVHLSL